MDYLDRYNIEFDRYLINSASESLLFWLEMQDEWEQMYKSSRDCQDSVLYRQWARSAKRSAARRSRVLARYLEQAEARRVA
ncbi:MAG: hypothetical protein KME11_04775 [Timaviella obliquedivisa GSE-PSE-MK23-08B]|jgi:hypothetical protein|nr:hypothetical protein [Timaviella obliquedivisa GSE-PSE-MK23-08B]